MTPEELFTTRTCSLPFGPKAIWPCWLFPPVSGADRPPGALAWKVVLPLRYDPLIVPPLADSSHLTTMSPSLEMAMSEEVVWS